MRRKTITIQEFYCATEKTQSPKYVYFEDRYQMKTKIYLTIFKYLCNLS